MTKRDKCLGAYRTYHVKVQRLILLADGQDGIDNNVGQLIR